MTKKDNKEKEPSMLKWWSIAIVLCLIIWIGGAAITHWYALNLFEVGKNDNAPALLGDSFGAVNALISAIAFAGMLVMFVLQRYELSLQRKELAAQRNEFNQQNATLKLQRFENTFFHMMELQQQIVNGLTLHTQKRSMSLGSHSGSEKLKEDFEGREVFGKLYMQLAGLVSRQGMKAYEEADIRTDLDHYFRNFYTILKMIHETKVFSEESLREEGQSEHEAKYKYASILRASLSRFELTLLYYNGLSAAGREKLKPLLEEYCMLNNLNASLLVLSKDAKDRLGVPDYAKDIEKTFENAGFTGTDYEVMISTEKGIDSKYFIGAFCHTEDERNALSARLAQWDEQKTDLVKKIPLMTEDEKRRFRLYGRY